MFHVKQEMKVLSLRQPWADAVLELGKTIENRLWQTTYRGPIAIHVAKFKPPQSWFGSDNECAFWNRMPEPMHNSQDFWNHERVRGAIVAIAELESIHVAGQRADCGDDCRVWGEYDTGIWHWRLAGVRRVDPIFLPGMQRLWTIDEETAARLRASARPVETEK
jgi:activating signal cointegrator 1